MVGHSKAQKTVRQCLRYWAFGVVHCANKVVWSEFSDFGIFLMQIPNMLHSGPVFKKIWISRNVGTCPLQRCNPLLEAVRKRKPFNCWKFPNCKRVYKKHRPSGLLFFSCTFGRGVMLDISSRCTLAVPSHVWPPHQRQSALGRFDLE